MRVFVLTISLVLFGAFAMAQTESTVLTNAESMPYFPGCDHHGKQTEAKRVCSNNALVTFITNNLTYPDSARSESIQGTVYVGFVIDEKGQVAHSSIIRGIGGGCDREALRVIREMPRWEPGYDQGKAVKVKLNLPIQFYLSDDKTDKAANYQINWGNLTGKKVTLSQLEQNLSKKLIVRDQNGDELHFSELIFSFEKRATYLEESSNGSINAKMKRLVKKGKPGGIFKITAVIHKKDDFIEVEKKFEVVK